MEIKFTDQNFEEEVEKSKLPVLVDFWAIWCGPCQMMGPIIEELAEKFEGKMKIGKINVDENPGTAQKYEVLGIPSLKFFKNGEIIDEITGLQPKEVIVEKIENLIS